MLKKMLATTAISALLAGPALAQDTPPPADPVDPPAMVDDAPDASAPEFGAPDDAPGADAPTTEIPENNAFGADEADPLADPDPLTDPDPLDAPDPMTDSDPVFPEDVIGADIVDFDGNVIATVDDVTTDGTGNVDAVLVDVGGFFGFGARTIAISLDDVTIDTDADGETVLRTSMTAEQLGEMPEYEADEPEGFDAEL